MRPAFRKSRLLLIPSLMSMVFLAITLTISMTALPGPVLAKEAQFVGIKGCKTCHKKKKQGEQTKIWAKSKHAEAYKVLSDPKAKKAAAKVGVSGDPQKAPECLVCHTTGFGSEKSAFKKKFKLSDGVQCESCHGAGSLYKKKKVMKKIYKEHGPDGKGESATAKETGFVTGSKDTCKRCHVKELTLDGKTYKNPSFKDFDFDKRWDKIKHPIPSK